MKIKITVLIVLILSTVLLLNYFKNESNKTNGSLESNDAQEIVSETRQGVTETASDTKLQDAITSIDEITLDKKNEIVSICHDSFDVEDSETYIALQRSNFGEITREQIKAWQTLFSFCENYKPVVSQLQKEIEEHPYYDPQSGVAYPYIELQKLAQEKGRAIAVEEAEKTLFSKEKAVRESASQYLLEDEEWINKLTEQANITEQELDTKREHIGAAIELRKCELNVEDCSAHSLGALRACGYNPEFCGLSLYDTVTMYLTPYELERIKQYLALLRRF